LGTSVSGYQLVLAQRVEQLGNTTGEPPPVVVAMTPEWRRSLLVGAGAGIAALALLILFRLTSHQLLFAGMFSELRTYMRKRDEFRAYLDERDTDGD
jgi:hypothetical protein